MLEMIGRIGCKHKPRTCNASCLCQGSRLAARLKPNTVMVAYVVAYVHLSIRLTGYRDSVKTADQNGFRGSR